MHGVIDVQHFLCNRGHELPARPQSWQAWGWPGGTPRWRPKAILTSPSMQRPRLERDSAFNQRACLTRGYCKMSVTGSGLCGHTHRSSKLACTIKDQGLHSDVCMEAYIHTSWRSNHNVFQLYIIKCVTNQFVSCGYKSYNIMACTGRWSLII